MYQCISMSQIVQELISKPLSLMRPWHESSDIKQLYRH